MSIKIYARRVLVNNEKHIKVLKIDALQKNNLPLAYKTLAPFVYKVPGCPHLFADGGITLLEKDKVYTLAEFNKIHNYTIQAGQRLTEVNARLAKQNRDWSGKHVVYTI